MAPAYLHDGMSADDVVRLLGLAPRLARGSLRLGLHRAPTRVSTRVEAAKNQGFQS